MTEDRKQIGESLQTGMITMLFVIILLLIVLSASSYRFTNEVNRSNSSERALRSYITACIRENRMSKVDIRDFDGAPGLSIRDAGEEYERRIYYMNGKLLEEYAKVDAPVSPDDALTIGETGRFEVTEPRKGLLRIETDCGVSYTGMPAR
jgi:hypothetical protein